MYNETCANFTIVTGTDLVCSADDVTCQQTRGNAFGQQTTYMRLLALNLMDGGMCHSTIRSLSIDHFFHCWDMASRVDFEPDGVVNALDLSLQERLNELGDTVTTSLRILPNSQIQYYPGGESDCTASRRREQTCTARHERRSRRIRACYSRRTVERSPCGFDTN